MINEINSVILFT